MTVCEKSKRRRLGFLLPLLAGGVLVFSAFLDSSAGRQNDDIVNFIRQEPKVSVGGSAVSVKLPVSVEGRDRTAMCVIIKNEEAYLDEWIDYHRAVGFTHFYIYDNSYHFDLQQWAEEQKDYGRPVTVYHMPGNSKQHSAYHDCMERLQTEDLADSVAFLDVDEFLVLRKHADVHDFMADYCTGTTRAVSLNWVMIGSNNRTVYEPQPVTKRFSWRWQDAKKFGEHFYLIESITRVHAMDLDGGMDAHYVTLDDSYTRVDTHRRVLAPTCDRNFNETDEIAGIYHFRSKSKKEYIEKFLRGRSGPRAAQNKKFVAKEIKRAQKGMNLEPGDYVDDQVWQLTKEFNPLYASFDQPLSHLPTPAYPSTETAAVCVVVENDEAYIDEWVDYHRMLGFSRFFFFDRTEDFQTEQWANEKGECVTIRHLPEEEEGEVAESRLVQDTQEACIQLAKENKVDWLAFFDVDNFLVLKQDSHVVDMLTKYGQKGGVGVYQYRFGTANRRVYIPKPVTERFQYREPTLEASFKRILRLNTRAASDLEVLGTNGKPATVDSSVTDRASDVAVFHYYATRSMKEYMLHERGVRALSEEASKDDPWIWGIFNGSLPVGTVRDATAWLEMKRMNPRYDVFEHLWIV